MIVVAIIGTPLDVNAISDNKWHNYGAPFAVEPISPLQDFMDPRDPACEEALVKLSNDNISKQACIRTQGSLRYTWGGYSSGLSEPSLAWFVNLTNEHTFYPVSNIPDDASFDSFYDENKVFFTKNGYNEHFVMDNFKDRLALTSMTTGWPSYKTVKSLRLLYNQIDSVFNLTDGGWHDISSPTYSQDGRWRYFTIKYIGVIRMNMDTYESQVVYQFTQEDKTQRLSNVSLKVNYDGSIVYTENLDGPKSVIYVTDECVQSLGRKVSTTSYEISTKVPSCQVRNFSYNEFKDEKSKYRAYEMSPNGQELILYVQKPYPEVPKWLKIYPSGYTPSNIEYLALGDSYSSGEGDIGKKENGSSYYRPKTEEDVDRCHISERSYPFLLRNMYNLREKSVVSMACSGARVMQDYFGESSNYMGQNDRLAEMDDDTVNIARTEAVMDDIPGRVKQVEFVKKYKPQVITLTAGGNDVGFADILEYCASGHTKLQVPFTCGYAQPGELRKMLAASISAQFTYNKMMVKAIQTASPNTKIYLVGYPSFTKTESETCLNSGVMNENERRMMNESVSFMNSVLRSVARATGAIYIDIEDSLKGGRLCEGSEYMTGLFDVGLKKDPNIFHPNSHGHRKIAHTIFQSGKFNFEPKSEYLLPDDSVETPEIPEYFKSYTVSDGIAFGRSMLSDPNLNQIIFIVDGVKKITKSTGDIFREGLQAVVKLSPQSFEPNTTVTARAYSEEVVLGEFQSSINGSLDEEINLDLDPGVHTIVIEGTTLSGENVKYYQIIKVVSADLNDIDGDGIPNAIDPCNFTKEWRDESTGDDVCIIKKDEPDSIQVKDASFKLSTNANKKQHTDGFLLKNDNDDQEVIYSPLGSATTVRKYSKRVSNSPQNASKDNTKQKKQSYTPIYLLSGIVVLLVVMMIWRGEYAKER